MVNVRVTAEVADCDPAPTLTLVEVSSNETGSRRVIRGTGNTDIDVEGADLGTADMDMRLRAERSGTRAGRVYTLVYEATDWAGNVARESVEVSVPHDEGRPARRR